MATGTTLDDNKIEEIKALLTAGVSKNSIASRLKVSWATVDKYSKQEPDKLESLREDKRTEFIGRLWSSMDRALNLADKRIEIAMDANEKLNQLSDVIFDSDIDIKKATELQRALDNITAVPLGQISTFIGTIYDKHALMTGGKTADIGLTYEDQLKKILGGANASSA
jgi:predicted transcriptional regulator